MGSFGFNLAIGLYIIGILSFLFNGGGNLIMLIICLELILLSIGILLVNISVGLDDLVGSNLCLYLLPLAGAESAVALALLVAYYPASASSEPERCYFSGHSNASVRSTLKIN